MTKEKQATKIKIDTNKDGKKIRTSTKLNVEIK
jgi:hypothetical protein